MSPRFLLPLILLSLASCQSDETVIYGGVIGDADDKSALRDNYVLGAGDPAPQAIALFNGKDLSGWDYDLTDENLDIHDVWSVQDGILICKGEPAGYIRTQGSYGDYELTVVYRWAPGTKGGNSGVLLHASTPRQLGIWPQCLESQLEAGSAGDFWQLGETISVDDGGERTKGRRIIRHTHDVEKPLGEWNTKVVRCEGGSVSVTVNGIPTNAGTNCTAQSGNLCFQSEGAEIHFKQISLKALH